MRLLIVEDEQGMAEGLRALHSNVQILSIRNAGYHLEVQP